jgi:hypothetical protein
MIPAEHAGDQGIVSVPRSAVDVELLAALQIAIIRNPPVELLRAGIRDGMTWRKFEDESAYTFFDAAMRGERALVLGKTVPWVFADGDKELTINGMLTNDEELSSSGDSTKPQIVGQAEAPANEPPPTSLPDELVWLLDPFDTRHPLPQSDNELQIYSPRSRSDDSLSARRLTETIAWQEEQRRARTCGNAIGDYDPYRIDPDDYHPYREPNF